MLYEDHVCPACGSSDTQYCDDDGNTDRSLCLDCDHVGTFRSFIAVIDEDGTITRLGAEPELKSYHFLTHRVRMTTLDGSFTVEATDLDDAKRQAQKILDDEESNLNAERFIEAPSFEEIASAHLFHVDQ